MSTSSELVEGTGLSSIIMTTEEKKRSFLHCLLQNYAALQGVVSPACK